MSEILADPPLLITLVVMGISLVLMVVIPIVPGQFIVWLAAVIYALVAGWETLGWPVFWALTTMMLIAAAVDFVLGALGARAGGASLWGLAGGFALGLVGLIFVNALGAVAGMLLGLLAVEWYRRKDFAQAWRASKGYLAGLLASVIFRFILAVLMVLLFLWKVV